MTRLVMPWAWFMKSETSGGESDAVGSGGSSAGAAAAVPAAETAAAGLQTAIIPAPQPAALGPQSTQNTGGNHAEKPGRKRSRQGNYKETIQCGDITLLKCKPGKNRVQCTHCHTPGAAQYQCPTCPPATPAAGFCVPAPPSVAAPCVAAARQIRAEGASQCPPRNSPRRIRKQMPSVREPSVLSATIPPPPSALSKSTAAAARRKSTTARQNRTARESTQISHTLKQD